MANQVQRKDPYDAFLYPDGTMLYRHEVLQGDVSPEDLERQGVQVLQHGSPEWLRHVDDDK